MIAEFLCILLFFWLVWDFKRKVRDLSNELKIRLKLEVEPENIKCHEEILKFGSYKFYVTSYYSRKFNEYFDFECKLTLMATKVPEKDIMKL